MIFCDLILAIVKINNSKILMFLVIQDYTLVIY